MAKTILRALYFLKIRILRTSRLKYTIMTQPRLSLLLAEQNPLCSTMIVCLKRIRWLVSQRMQAVLHVNDAKSALCVKLVGT